MENKKKLNVVSFDDFLKELKGSPSDVHKATMLHDEAIEILLDGLTDGFVRAFHEFGRRAMAQVHLSGLDCKDCGALMSFNIICPVDDFHYVLKETLKDKKIHEVINEQIKKGRDFNERKGFKIRRAHERIPEDEPKGHSIKVD